MQSSILVLITGLLTAPLALVGTAGSAPMQNKPVQTVQYSTGAPEQTIHGRPLTDAPVPDALPKVAPVDRAAGPGSRSLDAGPVNATPFSAAPTSAEQAGSQAYSTGSTRDGGTPSLGK